MGFSLKKAVKSAAKVIGASYTAGASLQGGSLGDIASGTLTNTASGIPGLSNIVNGAVGLGTDYLQSQVNLQNQMKLASHTAQEQNLLNEAAYQRNLQQWNMENAYNSPAEQMKRFEEAGLNKNLIYGQQNTSANSPTLQPATYDPGHYTPVDKSAQRQALKLALLEHQQRITNQAIENDLARQRLGLAARAADREDALAKAQIQAIGANYGLQIDKNDAINGLRRDTLAWRKYQDALKLYEKKADSMPWYIRSDPAKVSSYLGRKPMYMDFVD